MYIKKDTLTNIKAYLIAKNHFTFLTEELDIDILVDEDFSYKVEKGNLDVLSLWDDYVVLSSKNIQRTLILKGGEIKKDLGACFHINSNDFLLLQRRDEKGRFIDFYNKYFDVVESIELKVGKPFLSKSYYVFTEFLKASAFTIFDLQTKNSQKISIANNKWISTENEFYDGKIWQILGQWNNQLLVFIGKFRILAFDLKTGKELWRIEDFLNEISANSTLIFTKSKRISIKWLLSEEHSKAYLLVRNFFYELDLIKRKSNLVKEYNEASKLEWDFKESRLCGDVITFSASNKLGALPNAAGVIDINTKEILWTTKCESGVYFEEAPQIKDNKLYILDSQKNLHIFEKEN